MNTPELLQPLHKFLSQSRQLLALAQSGEWESFEVLLKERQMGMPALGENQLLIAVAKSGQADEMRDLLVEIQSINDQIGAVAETSRADLAEQLRHVIKADKAIDAYRK